MCKSGLNSYNYCGFPSTDACGKLVEKLLLPADNFSGLRFSTAVHSPFLAALADKWKTTFKYLKTNNLR